jgi:hypothetical protein
MAEKTGNKTTVGVSIDPGICGFECDIKAHETEGEVHFSIQSDCQQIRHLAENLKPVSMDALFVPLSRNAIFLSAEKVRCHLACPVPWGLVKAAEVALGLALPREATLRFVET